MPKPEPKWDRVKDENGHEYSKPVSRPLYDGETQIDKPAEDALGNPLPAKPNVNADRRTAAAARTAESTTTKEK